MANDQNLKHTAGSYLQHSKAKAQITRGVEGDWWSEQQR